MIQWSCYTQGRTLSFCGLCGNFTLHIWTMLTLTSLTWKHWLTPIWKSPINAYYIHLSKRKWPKLLISFYPSGPLSAPFHTRPCLRRLPSVDCIPSFWLVSAYGRQKQKTRIGGYFPSAPCQATHCFGLTRLHSIFAHCSSKRSPFPTISFCQVLVTSSSFASSYFIKLLPLSFVYCVICFMKRPRVICPKSG